MEKCFREGCENNYDGPNGVRLEIKIITCGDIGISGSTIIVPFCSLSCSTKFVEDHNFSQSQIAETIARLSRKMAKKRVLNKRPAKGKSVQ